MNKNIFTIAFGLAVLGCSSDSLPVSEAPSFSMREASSTLSLRTRTPDSPSQIRYYLSRLTMGTGPSVISRDITEGPVPIVSLPPGDYHIYAVGSDDLSAFTLPSAEEASDTALITPTTAYPSHDLLLADTLITLTAGDNATIDITFHRALLRLDTVTLHQVPNDATAASLTLSPLHANLTLGTGPSVMSSDITEGPVPIVRSMTIPLSKSDATTWQSTTPYYIFPSVGAPTLTISLTCPSEDDPSVPTTTTYTHTLDTPLEPNHPIALDATLPDDSSSDFPAVGTTYLGCYVLASDPVAQTLTLLSPTEKNGFVLSATESEEKRNLEKLNNDLNNWEIPEGTTGKWRVPTIEEAELFVKNTDICPIPTVNGKTQYYCLKNGIVTTYCLHKYGDKYYEYKELYSFGYYVILRPVIDLTLGTGPSVMSPDITEGPVPSVR